MTYHLENELRELVKKYGAEKVTETLDKITAKDKGIKFKRCEGVWL